MVQDSVLAIQDFITCTLEEPHRLIASFWPEER